MRWFILAVLFAARSCMAFEFQVLGALAPLVSGDLGLGPAAMGELIGLFWLPGIGLAMPAGIIGARVGIKRLALVSLGLMALGSLLLAVSPGYGMAAVARLVGGCGNALLSVLVSAMTAEWFRGRELSTALAIVFDSWQFGLALTLALFPALAEATSWRVAVGVASLACVAAAVLLALAYRAPEAAGPVAPPRPLPHPRWLLQRSSVVPTLAGVLWTTYNVGQLIFLTYAPPLLASRGLALPAAARIVSLTVWTAMLSMPLGGLAADRLGRPGVIIALGTGGAALAGALLVWGLDPAACCVAAGLFLGLPAGALLALPARAVPPGEVAWSLGWFMTVYYVLLTVTQLAAGYIRQGSGSDAAAALFGCALLAMTVPGLIPLRLVQRPPAIAATT